MNEPAADQGCRISVLGRFQVEAGGRVIIDGAWPRSKALQVLKLLALEPGRSLHREQVFDALWPDLEPAAATNNLRKNLHYLRAKFREEQAEDPVSLKGDAVTLAANVDLDVQAFRTLAERARATRTDPQPYEDALALYVADLLPDDRYEAWTEPHREQLGDLRNVLLQELGRLYQENGRPERGIELFQQLLRSEPSLEAAHQGLMRIYARTGRRDRAFRQYELLRETLRRELDVEPSPETEALHRSIADGRTDLGGGSAVPPASVAISGRGVESVPATQERRSPPRPWLRFAVASLLLAGVGGGIAAGLFAGGAVGGGDDGPLALQYQRLVFHQVGTGSIAISGDCASGGLIVDANWSGNVTGGINGRGVGSGKTMFDKDACRRGHTDWDLTVTDSSGNALSMHGGGFVSLVNPVNSPQSGTQDSPPGPAVITGGAGSFAQAIGAGTCKASVAQEDQQLEFQFDCSLEIAPAGKNQAAQPIVVSTGDSSNTLAPVTSHADTPKELYLEVEYENVGQDTLTGLMLELPSPQDAEITVAGPYNSPATAGGTHVWALPDLAPGEVARFDLTVALLSASVPAISLQPAIAGDNLPHPVVSNPVTVEVFQ